ncbi:MAG TPA: DUF1778 domain-containing protein [Rhizomicrobium sp.]
MSRSTLQKRPATRTRQERLEARISRDQKTLFQRAAALQGRTLTDFVLNSVHEAAVRTIEETQLIRLSAQDSRVFAAALINPKKPNEKLRAAAQRYKERFGG